MKCNKLSKITNIPIAGRCLSCINFAVIVNHCLNDDTTPSYSIAVFILLTDLGFNVSWFHDSKSKCHVVSTRHKNMQIWNLFTVTAETMRVKLQRFIGKDTLMHITRITPYSWVRSCSEGRMPGSGVGGTSSGRPVGTGRENTVDNETERDPSTCSRELLRRIGISKSTVHRLLKKK